ncbi:hypothetical protein HAQ00_02330 [Acidithiobacillus caldus ATCC 51756]|uniref:type II secretion system protein GspD n=1 Tax=Acidithiobacillus caldus TaxID=33059 RepID=UPI001C078994|nr:hypothetical protein [Acidithiobacillus caldus]MBU2734582.1 hypothetical protein [Acidithiobacillus caldus ATCC 51756]MBU2801327.1 hypothetical protein [Acidithiobacillus caldus]
MKYKVLVATATALALGGCAQPSIHQVAARQTRIVQQAEAAQKNRVSVFNTQYTGGYLTNYVNPQDSVTLSVNRAPVGALINSIAKGYSVFFAQGARPRKPVTLSVNGQGRLTAIREMAQAAGYCAIVDKDQRRVVIAKRGTYVFKIPTSVLLDNGAKYDVGGNNAASQSEEGSAGGGGGVGGGMAGGSYGGGSSGQLKAKFTVKGSAKIEKASALVRQIQSVAGEGSRVTANATTGLVTVTANADGLARATRFIQSYVDQADQRVAIHVALLEVSLKNGLQYGINWDKIVQVSGQQALGLGFINPSPSISSTGASGPTSLSVNNNGISASLNGTAQSYLDYSGQTISGIITALRQVTNARIISQPAIVAQNNTPATIFSGRQTPYVGYVSNQVSGLSGTATTGAAYHFVPNGLQLSVLPNILNGRLVSLRIMPSITSITGFSSTTVDGVQISAPNQTDRQLYLQTIVPNGKTLIIGGASTTTADNDNYHTPGLGDIPGLGYLFKGVNDKGEVSQLVILVHATIIPAPKYDPLVGESL